MFTDQSHLRLKQYRDSGNLDARIALHRRYSTNPYGWFRWVFDRLDLPPSCRVLELGCGAGDLWAENFARLPDGGVIYLSDLSIGMLERARQKLAGCPGSFGYSSIDAQSIPFPTSSFDAIISNHMLYHVPDKDRALEEIRRVLKPGGRLFAATNGSDHMRELDELILKIDPGWVSHAAKLSFRLENGGDLLGRYFPSVRLERYPDALDVTEVEPLMAYVLSLIGLDLALDSAGLARLDRFLREEITRLGAFHITKSACLFVCQ